MEAIELEALIEPVVESMGLELVEATFKREGGRRVLRVIVDREGGVDLDTIAEASKKVSRRLDLEDFGDDSYTLEVSSPGVERPLKKPVDFVKRVGERVKVKTYGPVDGARTHIGTIAAAGEDAVTIAVEDGERRLSYGDISSARTVFEWGPARGRR